MDDKPEQNIIFNNADLPYLQNKCRVTGTELVDYREYF